MNTIEKKLTNRKNNCIDAFKVAIASIDEQQFNALNISDANKQVLKKWANAKVLKLQKLVENSDTSVWFNGSGYETKEHNEKKWTDVDYGSEVFESNVTIRTARA